MGTPWGAILGAGISLLGINEQDKATDAANAANIAQTNAHNKFVQSTLDKGGAAALAAQKKGITFADQSYKDALGAASSIGSAATAGTLRREKAHMGAAAAGASNRGLGSSTVAQQAERGVYEATNQTLANINESIAGLFSQIHQNRGRTALQGYSQLAGIHQQTAQSKAGLATQITHQAADVGKAYSSAAYGIGKLIAMYQNDDIAASAGTSSEPAIDWGYYGGGTE